MIEILSLWNNTWPYLVAILLFLILIVIHEFGHFIAAKLSGVRVNEFAVGFGPKLFSFQGKETKYAINLVPLGGYCAMEGEDEESADGRAFCNKPAYKRFLIVVMGAVFNLILGFLVIVVFYSLQPQIAEPVATGVIEQSYAESVGIKPGDRIVKMNNSNINIYPDLKFFLMHH